ncbi:MAG: hypothetical protein ACRDIB_15005, partial [Ardenticatenaceae bacterium]
MHRLYSILPLLLALLLAGTGALVFSDAASAQGLRMREVGGYGLVLRDTAIYDYGSLDSNVVGEMAAGTLVYLNGWQIGVYHVGDLQWIADRDVQPIVDAYGNPMANSVTRQGDQYY